VADDLVEIVRAGDGDVPAITALVRAAYEGYVPRMGVLPKPMTLEYADVVRTRMAWVVRRDGDVAAVLVLEPHEDHLLLENIAVAPNAQRTGIGDRLMRFAEEQARALGLPEIRLFTNAAMVENLGYYGRRGYRETHRETVDGRHRVFLTKHL
jgi:N-acetylglutamate synthase-like GNAT family acetyltransferase